MVLLIGLLLVAGGVMAQTCTGYTFVVSKSTYGISYGPVWRADDSSATQLAVCQEAASNIGLQLAQAVFTSNVTYTYEDHSYDVPTSVCTIVVRATRINTNGVESQASSSQIMGFQTVGDQCAPPPDECEPDESVGQSYVVETTVPAESCNPVNNCKMVRGAGMCMGGSCVYTVTQTDQNCGSGDDETEPPPPGEGCTTSGSVEFCKDGDEDNNCGFLNGEFICVDQTEDDGCQVMGDGSRVCGPDAPTPPVPDNGTPGVPAEPDEVIETNSNNETNTYNYYDSSTVGGSARDPGDSGDNPDDGDDDGSGAIGQGDGEGEGEGECPEGATCDGSLPSEGEFESVCTFGECAQQFFERVSAAPLVAGVLGVGAGFPSGSCPNWTLEAFGEDYLLSGPMCDIWENVSSLLSAMFLVIWAWVATRIVLSA